MTEAKTTEKKEPARKLPPKAAAAAKAEGVSKPKPPEVKEAEPKETKVPKAPAARPREKSEAKAPAKQAKPPAKAKPAGATLKLVQVGSPIGRDKSQRATLIGLGLNKMHRTRELPDTPETRGMLEKVKHLVKVVEK